MGESWGKWFYDREGTILSSEREASKPALVLDKNSGQKDARWKRRAIIQHPRPNVNLQAVFIGTWKTRKRLEVHYLLGFPAFIGAASIELVAVTRMNTGFQKQHFKMYHQKYHQQTHAAPRCPACDAQFLHNHTCNVHSYGISPTVPGTIGVNARLEGLRRGFGTATKSRHVGRV
jgi:hypothetical protein